MLGDNQLLERWFRFVGAAVTKISTTRVPAYGCGTDRSSWLDGAHPSGIIAVFTLMLRYLFFRDFTQSSFRHNNFNDLKLLGQIFYVDDIPINCAIKTASVEFHRTGYFHYFGRFCTLAAFC